MNGQLQAGVEMSEGRSGGNVSGGRKLSDASAKPIANLIANRPQVINLVDNLSHMLSTT